MESKLLTELSKNADYIRNIYYSPKEEVYIFHIEPNFGVSVEYYSTLDFNLFFKIARENFIQNFEDVKLIPKYSFVKHDLKSALKISAKLAFVEGSSKIVSPSIILEAVEYFKDKTKDKDEAYSICILNTNKLLINRHFEYDKDKFTYNKLEVNLFKY